MAYTTIDKPTDYFNTVLYTGNGSTQSITGVGFQPDFIWLKSRNNTYDHFLYDAVRGQGKYLQSNKNYVEADTDQMTSFDSDGYTVGVTGGVATNGSGSTMASWNWLANGAGSANTDGSISSTVSANTTSGFSIVSYTGNGNAASTVGHGLGAIPAMVIIKTRNTATYNWYVKHKSLASNNNVFLNLTNGTTDVSSQSQGGIGNLDNSSTFSFANGSTGIESVNKSSDTYIAYCFAEKQGYSKFGSYTGNGNADGTFVYTGFKPAFTIIKSTGSDQWSMFDAKRNPFNEVDNNIRANSNAAEADQANKEVDYLSNGVKLRTSSGEWNTSGTQYIYMAFAENPFVTSTGVPATAR